MIIEVVAFFIWVFLVLVIGAIATIRRRKKRTLQGVDNISVGLTFPQRNWLPLCLMVALISPLLVTGFKAVTRKKTENVSVDRNGASYLGGDTTLRDTTYHVATPPQTNAK
jgi:hypothetical protein